MNSGNLKVVGHSKVRKKLQQLIIKNRVPGTMIFAGRPSVGKFKVALKQAQYLFCPESCGVCGHCVRVAKGQHERLRIVQSEGQQPIKVGDIRDVVKFLSLQNEQGEAKVVIVDGAEKLNLQAANAFLKTLEEPPENCHIILVTSSLYRLLPTIRSRGQVFRFGSLSSEEIRQVLPNLTSLGGVSSGRMDLVTKYSDANYLEFTAEIRASLLTLTRDRLSDFILKLQPNIKDKNKCAELVSYLQLVLTQAFKLSLGSISEGEQAEVELMDKLKLMNPGAIMDLFQETVILKQGLHANFDMALGLESFFLKWLDSYNLEQEG